MMDGLIPTWDNGYGKIIVLNQKYADIVYPNALAIIVLSAHAR